jgi:hypothetical protein
LGLLQDSAEILAHAAQCCQARIDRFPQHTLEWLSLPVLADPFWGRLPRLLKRPGGKTQQARSSAQFVGRQDCARVRVADFGELIFKTF